MNPYRTVRSGSLKLKGKGLLAMSRKSKRTMETNENNANADDTAKVTVVINLERCELERFKALTGIKLSAPAILSAARNGAWIIEKMREVTEKALANADPVNFKQLSYQM